MAKNEPKEKIVGLPLSEDYQEGGIKFDPSQKVPESKKAKKASKK